MLERPWLRLPSLTLCGEMIPLCLEKSKAQTLHGLRARYVHSNFGFLPPAAVPGLILGRSFFFLQKEKASGMTVKTRQSFACRKMSDVAATHSLNAM